MRRARRCKLTEREFQAQVVGLARLCGWKVAHFRPARTARGWVTPMQGDVGYPDLTLARERVIWVELKIPPNGLTAAQAEWLEALRGAGAEVHVWCPDDWTLIEQTLGLRRT